MTRLVGVLAVVAAACTSSPPGPAVLDTATEHCRSCQMPISDAHTASQIVAPGEETRFFDDLACLRAALTRTPLAADARVFVVDHRSGQWVDASRAVFSEVPGLATPMASGLVAHADAATRDADLRGREVHPVARRSVLVDAPGDANAR